MCAFVLQATLAPKDDMNPVIYPAARRDKEGQLTVARVKLQGSGFRGPRSSEPFRAPLLT